jgi:hypothetical protein
MGIVGVGALDHVVLHVGSEPVLGTEDRGQRDAVGGTEAIHYVEKAAIHRCMVTDDAGACPGQASALEQEVGAETDAAGGG